MFSARLSSISLTPAGLVVHNPQNVSTSFLLVAARVLSFTLVGQP